MDAISLLQNDHRKVERLFARFEKLTPRAVKTMRDLNEQIIHELSVHAVIEEQVLYPAIRDAVPAAEADVLEALEEHHVVKWTLSELDGMDPEHERFRPKMMVLIESVRHHVEEEEGELFPQVRSALSADELEALGAALEAAKSGAPTRPHPKAPDEPPGNIVAGAGAALLDKARDAGRSAVREAGKKAKEAGAKGKSATSSSTKSSSKSSSKTKASPKASGKSADKKSKSKSRSSSAGKKKKR
jgi:hemerythrin superfamily protein